MKRSLCLAVALLALVWVACTGSDEFPSNTSVPPTPTGTLVLEHTPQARGLDASMTHLVLRGLTRDGRVLSPSQTLPLGGSIRVELPISVHRVQIDYHAGDAKVGEFDGFVSLREGSETVLDPSWVKFPQSHPVANTFGADLEGMSMLQLQYPRALPPNLVPGTAGFSPSPPTLPPTVRVPELPPIGAQGTAQMVGSPGTCIAWSYGYGLAGYTASRHPDGSRKHDIALPQYQPSPAYLFSQAIRIEKLTDCSKSTDVYLPYMVFDGSATLADVPYYPDCDYIMGLDPDKHYEDRFNVRVGAYYTVSTGLGLLQQLLDNGQVMAFAGILPNGFSSNPTFDSNGVMNPGPGDYGTDGHGMLLVGYDNALEAFLIQNSFGTGWPGADSGSVAPEGQFYWDYDSWLAHYPYATMALPVEPSAPTGLTLNSTPTGAPTAIISAVTQVPDESNVYLVLSHWFELPVQVDTIRLETPGGVALTQSFLSWRIQNGYSYLLRQDGHSWEPGDYKLTLEVSNNEDEHFTLTGTVTVTPPPSGWPQPTAAPVPSTVLGSNLLPVKRTP